MQRRMNVRFAERWSASRLFSSKGKLSLIVPCSTCPSLSRPARMSGTTQIFLPLCIPSTCRSASKIKIPPPPTLYFPFLVLHNGPSFLALFPPAAGEQNPPSRTFTSVLIWSQLYCVWERELAGGEKRPTRSLSCVYEPFPWEWGEPPVRVSARECRDPASRLSKTISNMLTP